jgi:hypothetical protein
MSDDDFSPPPPPAEPISISPRMRRIGLAVGFVLIAAAIFLEQWCHFQSMPHPTSPPVDPNGSASQTMKG